MHHSGGGARLRATLGGRFQPTVGLPARLPSSGQTPARRGQAGLGQATKQGSGWPQPRRWAGLATTTLPNTPSLTPHIS
jgi:hypothetical protein